MRVLVLAVCAYIAVVLNGCEGVDYPSAFSAPRAPTSSNPSSTTILAPKRSRLPTKIIAGYTSGATPAKVSLAVERGMNVIFWSFMELKDNRVIPGFNAEYISDVLQSLPSGADVRHFVSIGGWNAPHHIAGTCGAVTCSGSEYARSFRAFNEELKINVSGFPGFDGIDWDYEGVNNPESPSNNFTLTVYELMLNITQELKDEFLFSLVPPQSYFDCTASSFSPSLSFPAESTPSFAYTGENAYAVLYAKCPDCFDLVMVQLYEGYSRAGFDLYWGGHSSNVGKVGWPRDGSQENMQSIVQQNMQCLVDGWTVGFEGYWGVESQQVVLPPSKVVLALGNGWACGAECTGDDAIPFKFPFFNGMACGAAWCNGVRTDDGLKRIRGFAYWDIRDDDATASFVTDLNAVMTSCSPSVLVVMV